MTSALGGSSTGGTTASLANVVSNVASIPVGDNATVGSTVGSTADSVTTTVDPVVAPVIDSCVNVPPAGVSVDLGSSCGGGSGILDPITSAVAPITDPLANVCLSTAGVDAQAGTTCTGSSGGSGDLLGPVTGIVDQGTGSLNPVIGDLSLPPVDTQPVTDTTNQVINPLDVCAGVNPINVNEALGAGCNQSPASCTTLNVNCLLNGAADPVIGPAGALNQVLDACLGYDPAGFNLDIGSACAASTPPPAACPPDCGTTCPPDCGPPVCSLFCGPIFPTCPPDCGLVTCPPVCGVTPTDTGTLGVAPSNTGAAGNTASGGSLVLYVSPASAVTGAATTSARPPAALLSSTAAAMFAPPAAGDAGLLGRGWGDGTQPADPALLLIGLFVVACALRRRRLLHD